ncbi:FtsX-like permease family protein [uncultured Pseudoteredinibacter sp.]|uniref:ABC transporter permease n=1 Tax=uncultured Pseudoteredinibacter sp. TaxID=1641701 RepID=UPI00262078A3|nr:FtsX-like permease family protein [uncultured Pseudoteredinibacter sp.]MCV6621886.1 ABC transporter permease [Cellvibrionaceae bacterium]
MFTYYCKLAWRHILQTPALSLLIIMAIALGIGASMTMISYYKAMAHNPAGDRSDKLHAVQLAAYGNDMETWGMSDGFPRQLTHQDVKNLREADLSFPSTPIYQFMTVIVSQREGVAPSNDYAGRFVDRDFFSMFDVKFLHGGPWSESVDEQPENQVVISKALSEWIFGEVNSVGKTFAMLDGIMQFTVAGVYEEFNPQPAYYDLTTGYFPREGAGVFAPYSLVEQLETFPMGNISGWQPEEVNGFKDILKSEYVWQVFWTQLDNEAAKAQYKEFLKGYVEQQRELGRFANQNPRGDIKDVETWLNYNEVISEDNRVMVGMSLLFLLVCLVNAVGLLLAKFMRKMNEAGVRRALGASKGQIFSQYLVEVGMLGFFGGLVGLLLASIGLWAVRELYGTDIARLDFSLFIGALLLSLLASLLTGILPALRVCNSNPSIFLKAQ